MRVNVYAEEITDRIEIVEKDGFTGVRFYMYLPVTIPSGEGVTVHRGPFQHHKSDDDSAAVTFWSRGQAREVFAKAIALLDKYHEDKRR